MAGTGSKSWAPFFERIANRVPVLKGYRAKEQIRDVDKILREHTTGLLTGLKDTVDGVKRDRVESGLLAGLDKLDRVTRLIDRCRDTHQYAAYGYSGYFDPVKIREEELSALYETDAGLLEQVQALEAEVAALASPSATEDEKDRQIRELEDKFRALCSAIERRKETFQKIQ